MELGHRTSWGDFRRIGTHQAWALACENGILALLLRSPQANSLLGEMPSQASMFINKFKAMDGRSYVDHASKELVAPVNRLHA